jgi:hypothetical protein
VCGGRNDKRTIAKASTESPFLGVAFCDEFHMKFRQIALTLYFAA